MKTDPIELDVYPKFKTLLRPLSQDERQRLEWSILKEGILDPIKYWVKDGKNYIIDGHNRHEIYQKFTDDLSNGYQATELKFNSEDEVLEWILENQLRRRNLNQNERTLYLGQLFEMRKKRRGGLAKDAEGGSTADQIAGEQDVSARTVTRAAEVALAYNEADKEMQEKFASGEISQAELLRSIKKKDDATAAKKDKLHNDRTNAMAAVGERIMRTIKALRNHAEDYIDVCKALKIDPHLTAPLLALLAKGLAKEEAEALAMTTMVYVGNLCQTKTIGCSACHRVQYVTAAQYEDLKEHFGLVESGAGDSEAGDAPVHIPVHGDSDAKEAATNA